MSDQAAPGWYPVDERIERWWDGLRWSGHQRPAGQGAGVGSAPAVSYPYAGDTIQPPFVRTGLQGRPLPYQPHVYEQPTYQGPPPAEGRPPHYFGEQHFPGQGPAHGLPGPRRSVGRVVAAGVVGLLGVVFTLAALSQITRNAGSGAHGVGYVVGSLLIPAIVWTGCWLLVRRPRQ
jgi:hypothetical protein